MSDEEVARVFRRLAHRLQGVVADTLMMTISPEYAAHFLEVYVKKPENTKFAGDRVCFLMLTLPFVVLDLIAPEVFQFTLYTEYTMYISSMYLDLRCIYQVYELTKRSAQRPRTETHYCSMCLR